MQCPFIELFFWKRIVVNRLSDRDHILDARIIELKGGSRWVLEDESQLRLVHQVKKLARSFGVLLGVDDVQGQSHSYTLPGAW